MSSASSSPTVGLAMLVKDEADGIAATLASALPAVDAWTVLDTGSTDATRDIVRDALDGVPGELLEHPFDGFGPSRTRLLKAAAGKADYTLMLDADHTLHLDGHRPDLSADAYLVRVLGDEQWRLPLLTRSGHPFEYKGAAHSYLDSETPFTHEPTEWLAIDGGPGATDEKIARDRVLLEQSFAADPADARTVFYLAQTYRFLGQIEDAIRFYRLRVGMGGYQEEVYFSRYQIGCLLSTHVSFAQGASELLAAWQDRPTRAEALRALANAANAVADKIPLPDDMLFVWPSAYRQEAAA